MYLELTEKLFNSTTIINFSYSISQDPGKL